MSRLGILAGGLAMMTPYIFRGSFGKLWGYRQVLIGRSKVYKRINDRLKYAVHFFAFLSVLNTFSFTQESHRTIAKVKHPKFTHARSFFSLRLLLKQIQRDK